MSIVTPTLNRAPFLKTVLRSVREQTYPRVEHIVIDGGSTDSSVELLKSFEKTYDLRWISEPDGGMYAAINKGLRMARGEILAYINSDDLYLPWTASTVVEEFRRHDGPAFVFGDAINVTEDGSCRLLLQPPFDRGYIGRTGFLIQPTVFWNRQAYELAGEFDERLRWVADCAYWIRVPGPSAFCRVDEVLAIERDHRETQRVLHRESLQAELAGVRLANGGAGLSGMILGLRDRVRAYTWRRILLFRFLAATTALFRAGWQQTIRDGRPRIRWTHLALSFVPRFGARYHASAIVWDGHICEVTKSAEP